MRRARLIVFNTNQSKMVGINIHRINGKLAQCTSYFAIELVTQSKGETMKQAIAIVGSVDTTTPGTDKLILQLRIGMRGVELMSRGNSHGNIFIAHVIEDASQFLVAEFGVRLGQTCD